MERCHYGDTVCLTRVIQWNMHSLKDGRPDLNFPPLDPLFIEELHVVQGTFLQLLTRYDQLMWIISMHFDNQFIIKWLYIRNSRYRYSSEHKSQFTWCSPLGFEQRDCEKSGVRICIYENGNTISVVQNLIDSIAFCYQWFWQGSINIKVWDSRKS